MKILSISVLAFSLASAQQQPFPTAGTVERLDPALDQLIAPNTRIEVIASGFTWSEGPVWDKKTIASSFPMFRKTQSTNGT
ncbi:hypothetical protein N9Z97_00720 [Akkermansiaceae bacterium]|nr:hypothetical protein [Akkermansiaceae bacterium]